jgi:predicted DNA-binding transcriptional regulator YafY
MLANGMQPAEIAAALRDRFRVTLRTAQRDLEKCRREMSL